MNSQKQILSIVAVLAIAAILISAVAFANNGPVDAKKNKAQLKAQIKQLKAEIKALKKGGVTASEKAQLKKLNKALGTAEGQYTGAGISQSNTQSQSSNCSTSGGGNGTSSISGSCNNTQESHNNNTGGVIVNGSG